MLIIFIFYCVIMSVNIYSIKYRFLFIISFVMNMGERAEDIDYEPDVLKFINLWN